MSIVDFLYDIYKKSFSERARRSRAFAKHRTKRKGRLVAMKVVNKKGILQTVYINPSKNKKGYIQTRSKHVRPDDIKLKEIVSSYIDSYRRMIYKDHESPSKRREFGQVTQAQHPGITRDLDNLIRKYGLPKSSNGTVRKKLFQIAADKRKLDNFLRDARNIYGRLMRLEKRGDGRRIRDLIDRNFKGIESQLLDKKKRGGVATILRNINNGKQKSNIGIYKNLDRVSQYDFLNKKITPLRYNAKTIAKLRKSPYYNKYSKLAKMLSGTKSQQRKARKILSKEKIPRSFPFRHGRTTIRFINPNYARVYGSRILNKKKKETKILQMKKRNRKKKK